MRLKMSKRIVLCFAVILGGISTILTDVNANSMQIYPWDKRAESPRKYCGNILADVLHLVCKGKYYSITGYNTENLSSQKKSTAENDDGYWLRSLEDPPQEEFPFRSRLNSASMVRHRLFRRNAGGYGIVQECCVKGCTFSELSLYCANR